MKTNPIKDHDYLPEPTSPIMSFLVTCRACWVTVHQRELVFIPFIDSHFITGSSSFLIHFIRYVLISFVLVIMCALHVYLLVKHSLCFLIFPRVTFTLYFQGFKEVREKLINILSLLPSPIRFMH